MTEHDRLRLEALQALRRAQLCLRKLSTDGTDVTPQRQAIREASELVGRIRRDGDVALYDWELETSGGGVL